MYSRITSLSLLFVVATLPGSLLAQRLSKQVTLKSHTAARGIDDFVHGGPAVYGDPTIEIRERFDRRGNVIGSYLRVQGTQGDDDIEVITNAGDIQVIFQGILQNFTFPAEGVDEILIFGLAGDDRIENRFDLPDTIFGGEGWDTIIGGPNTSVIYGQGGNDRIIGGGNTDFVYGNEGDDDVAGGDGADFVFGGPGEDDLSGGFAPNHQATSDDLWNDILNGGADADVFYQNYEGQDTIDDLTDEDMIAPDEDYMP